MENVCPYVFLRATSSPWLASSMPSFHIYHVPQSRSAYTFAVQMEAVGTSEKLEREVSFHTAPITRITINITLIILGEEHELRSYSLCNRPQSFITSPHVEIIYSLLSFLINVLSRQLETKFNTNAEYHIPLMFYIF
jgi:hypothetical protein